MKATMEEYARLKMEKEVMEDKLKEAKKPFISEITEIEERMKAATEDLSLMISTTDSTIKTLGTDIIEAWEDKGPATIELSDGLKIVRSTLKSVEVHHERSLLLKLLELIDEDDKLPFKVKWKDKAIVPLIDANVINKDTASTNLSYRLSLRRQKD